MPLVTDATGNDLTYKLIGLADEDFRCDGWEVTVHE